MQLGQLWVIRYKLATNQLPLLRCWEQKAWSLHRAPPRGWADHLSHASWPTHRPAPVVIAFKLPSSFSLGASKGTCTSFAPLCCSISPSEALPEILIWTLINIYWLKSPRARVGNIYIKFLLNALQGLKILCLKKTANIISTELSSEPVRGAGVWHSVQGLIVKHMMGHGVSFSLKKWLKAHD